MIKKLTKRGEKALTILKDGGYFRKALERHYLGGEKFHVRLRNSKGQVVKGIGELTYYELKDAGLLQWRECAKSSVWPEEYILKGE